MKITFHSPLKSPNHPVPSGDRLMARLLIAALERAGHGVETASELRSFMKEPSDEALRHLEAQAEAEISRLSRLWERESPPNLWFTYHPYYKAPDMLGPRLCRAFAIPYITAEASHSRRRDAGAAGQAQTRVLEAIGLASVNICFTARDRQGLLEALPEARVAMLPPFLDCSGLLALAPEPQQNRLVTVAMMRRGDKMDSYSMLATALDRLSDIPWSLSIIGDGPCRDEVGALFARFGAERITWHGERTADEIAVLLSTSCLYVWPGCGEAYGLAYLEAQAAGLPVVAQAVAGVPEVVADGVTGLLTPGGDVATYAGAIRRLLTDDALRAGMASAARRMVGQERSLDMATRRLSAILNQYTGTNNGN